MMYLSIHQVSNSEFLMHHQHNNTIFLSLLNSLHLFLGNCEEDEAILVGYTSGSSYTFKEDDSGKELFFACDVGQRCEAGKSRK